MLIVKALKKSFATPDGSVEVLKGVDLKMAAGSSYALMGDSGCGKSTLLHILAGIEAPDSGDIILNGRDISGLEERERADLRISDIGLIFQQFNLITSLSVASNIAFHARLKGGYDPAYAADLSDRLGIGSLLTRMPEELSGGQQQRVAIARTFAARPRLILADEPTGNLDEETSNRVLDLALGLVSETNTSFFMVTHSKSLAERTARRGFLKDGRVSDIS